MPQVYPVGFGDSGNVTGPGVQADPIALAGTGITGLTSPMIAWAARAHRQSMQAQSLMELWFQRDGVWFLSPAQMLTDAQYHPVLRRKYRQPAQLTFVLADQLGILTPTNLTSSANTGSTGYEPLLNEARPVLLRAGCFCFNNIAAGAAWSSSIAPTAGSLSSLSDGVLAGWAGSSALPAGAVAWQLPASGSLSLTVDLGSIQSTVHVGIRFGTIVGTVQLPASVEVALSTDGINWSAYPIRSVGGASGDWADGYEGDPNETNVTEIDLCDLNAPASWVRLIITGGQEAQVVGIDEIAVWGGSSGAWLGMNRFVGYLGDSLEWTPEGLVRCTATDVLKKLADNNETRLTGLFNYAELADISYSLLTGATYWRGSAGAYDAPFTASEIGWQSGVNLTGFKFPTWQSQSNNQLGYQYTLWNEIGWQLYADGNGILQATEPPYMQQRPDRVLINAQDGNGDVRFMQRRADGKELRNVVEITSGAPQNGQGGSLVEMEPASVAQFGHRRVIITDPIATIPDFRLKVAQQVLRDYAWRLANVQCEIAPDFETNLRNIHGFRTSGRLAFSAHSSTNTTQELWSLMALEEHFTSGKWWATAAYQPYVAQTLDPPDVNAISSSSNNPATVTLTWAPLSEPHLAGFNVYASTGSDTGPWTLQTTNGALPPATTQYSFGSYTPGIPVWAYATCIDDREHESLPSVILSVLAAGGSESQTGWTVTDLAVSFGQTQGPDSQGYTTYEFDLLWTSPPANLAGQDHGMYGFKHMILGFSIGSLPSDPTNHWLWNRTNADYRSFDRVPPGMQWDRQTYGQLNWVSRWRTSTPVPHGSTVYYRIWTSSTSLGWHNTFIGNIASCSVP